MFRRPISSRFSTWQLFLSGVAVVLLSSCRKDPDIEPVTTAPYIFDYPAIIADYLPPVPVPANNPMSEEGVDLGRRLFFDERLSADNTQSCGSCHIPSASFSDTTAFSKGIDGLNGYRNTMPIIN